jgi:hypothetical protein
MMKQVNTMLEGRSRYNGVSSDVSARLPGPNSFWRKYLVNTWIEKSVNERVFTSLQFEFFWHSNKLRNYTTIDQKDAFVSTFQPFKFVEVMVQYCS